MTRRSLLVAAAVACLPATASPAAPPAKPVDRAALNRALKVLTTYDWGHDRNALDPIDRALNVSKGNAALRRDLEKRFIAVLRSTAPQAAKDFACRKLWMVGTVESVGALAALLPDKDLSHMARYALERMAYPEAGRALRDALGKVSGRLKVGMINSLGAREDAEAVGALIGLLKNADAEIAGAAAAALGKAGTREAARALADFRSWVPDTLRAVAVDASLDVARRLLAKGLKDEAAKVYKALEAQGQPPHVRMAAFRGLVSASPAEATPRLVKALAGPDELLRGQAAQLIAEAPGKAVTQAFADALATLPPAGQVVLLGALAARKDPAARPAILGAVRSQDSTVRAAAVAALATTGNAADVKLLAGLVASEDRDAALAARSSLARIPGDDVGRAIVAAIKGAAPGVRAELIRCLAARNARTCIAAVVECVTDSDASVRLAALDALGALGGAEQTAVAVGMLKATKDTKERAAAERALLAICSRGREKSAGAVLAGLAGAETATRCVLLRALSRAGGARALAAVRSATKDQDDKVKDEAVRILSGWPDLAAAGALLTLARTAEKTAHRVLALRGYVRLAGLPKSDAAKLTMLAEAERLAKGPGEKRLVLGGLGNVPTPASLRRILTHLEDPALVEEACAAAVRIARAVAGKDRALVRLAMARVLQKTKNRRTRRDAERMLSRVRR